MKRMRKIAAVALSFILLLTGCNMAGGSSLAKVNGESIDKEVYEKTLGLYSPSYEMQFGSDIWSTEIEKGVTFRQKFEEEILEKMINDKLILQDAKKKEITIPSEELEKQFTDLKASIEKQEDFKSALEKNNIDDAFLKAQIEQDMIIQKYHDEVMKENTVTDEEVKKYYDEHLDALTNSQVKASHILFMTKNPETQEDLSEDEKAKKKESAEKVLKLAKDGGNFAELAKTYSEDTGSAVNGGDLGYFDKYTMVKPFSDAAFSMKPGEISEIVESEFGYHIIKVIDKKDEVQKFESVQESIRSNLEYEKYDKVIEALKQEAKIEKDEENVKKILEEINKKLDEQKASTQTEPTSAADNAEPAPAADNAQTDAE